MPKLPPGRLFEPWPPGMRFANISRVELAAERRSEGEMPSKPDRPGLWGSSAASRCTDVWYAERGHDA
jgi:hypothetical protein